MRNFLTCFAILLFFALSAQGDNGPTVTIKNGPVEGITLDIDGTAVDQYLGIPYAQKPVGHLRFRKPLPIAEKRTSVFMAKKWPTSCQQVQLFDFHHTTFDEDCLYLNIWTPSSAVADGILRPVFVFIHYGGFVVGSSTDKRIAGAKLAATHDILVLNFNYRLGAFGFLYGGVDDAPGNAGLHDQVLLLEWVQDNIKYFGGDPEKVTLAGLSAGGMSVSLHLLSSPSHGLFKNAIMCSGAALDDILIENKDTAFLKAKALATMLGCGGQSAGTTLTGTEIDCLRKVDAQKLAQAGMSMEISKLGRMPFLVAFSPVYGDEFLPHSPKHLLLNNNFKQNANIMIGTARDEGSAAAMSVWFENGFKRPDYVQSAEDYMQALSVHFSKVNWTFSEADMEQLYFSNVEKTENVEQNFFSLLGDATIKCPTLQFSEALSRKNNVYNYLFSYKVAERFMPSDADPPSHGDDVKIMFGTLEENDEKDLHSSKTWMSIIADFTKGKTHWPPARVSIVDTVLSPHFNFLGENKSEILMGYKNYECNFWNRI